MVQNANLTTGGPITVTATAGPLTMGGAMQSTAGGNITYQGAGDVTLRRTDERRCGGGDVNGRVAPRRQRRRGQVTRHHRRLQAGNVIGSAADPLDIAVTGLANVNAGGMQAGDSIQINGTTGDNTLHFPLSVPGRIFFNGILLHPLAPPLGGAERARRRKPRRLHAAIASCDLTAGAGDLVRFPASCAPGVTAKGELAAPLPELPEPAP